MKVARQLVERTTAFVEYCVEAVQHSLKKLAEGIRDISLFLSSILSHVLLLFLTVAPVTLSILVVWGLYNKWDELIVSTASGEMLLSYKPWLSS